MSHNVKISVLIISTGRTGTQSIAHHIQRLAPAITALHEPQPSRRFRFYSNLYLCGVISKKFLSSRLISARRELLDNIDTDVYLESNPFLYGCLDVLSDAFPNARLVHVVRDPRTYIPSHINHGVYHGLKGFAGKYIPYWLLKPERCDAQPAFKWKDVDERIRLAWLWDAINTQLDRGAELFGDRYLKLRFEDLFDEKTRGLEQILEWIGRKPEGDIFKSARSTKKNPSRIRRCDKFSMWDKHIQDKVLEICGNKMHNYGYSLNGTTG